MIRTFGKNGFLSAVTAYFLWGVLPVYWKALQTVPAPQILGHRIVWSFVFLGGLVVWRKEWQSFRASVQSWRRVLLYTVAAVLLAINWLTYIWAVNSGRIVETSLGYFVNPLVSIVLGAAVLRERLGRLQWLAVGLAAGGVAWLTLWHGGLPWVALVLAFSFAFYGLAKKKAPLGALHGLVLETAILALPACIFLLRAEARPNGLWTASAWTTRTLLVGTGIITALPLLLFAHAARVIKLSTLGLLQYLSPTCGLALGIWVYGEPFSLPRFIGFAFIWLALLLSWLDWALRRRRSPVATPDGNAPPLDASEADSQ